MRQDKNLDNKKYWDKHLLEVIKAACRLEVKEEVPVWARYRLFWRIWIVLSTLLYLCMLIVTIVRNVKFEWLLAIPSALVVCFAVDFILYLISVYVAIISTRMKAGKYVSVFIVMFLLTRIELNKIQYKGNNILALSIIVASCSCIVFKIIYVIAIKLKNK